MKIVLAYSGGLDTSVIIQWLKERYDAEIIAFTADVGQEENVAALEKKALQTGATSFYFQDLKELFVKEYILPSLFASAIYEGKYPLATALSRPLIARQMVEVARKEGADALAHGCTGKGNDQVRFELAFKYLAPDLEIIAPARVWEFKSREEEIVYAKKAGIPVPVSKKSPYSLDWNLWGISIECGILEDPYQTPPEDAYQWTVSPENAPSTPEYIELGFEEGVPVTLNGEGYGTVALIQKLNEIASRHGVGRIDLLENRLVGIKSREIYESPAATVLHSAHTELERLVMERKLFHYKTLLSEKYAELVYNGYWFSQLRESLDAFMAETQRFVTGDVRLKLYRGLCTAVGRRSPYSLYEEDLSTYTEKDLFDHKASKGFIDLYGLSLLLEGKRWKKIKK
ncbi:MAG: argininosuccinate synthase [Candidatus Ratteibacteria bacterium]|jgi:argininosuccinate synthase